LVENRGKTGQDRNWIGNKTRQQCVGGVFREEEETI